MGAIIGGIMGFLTFVFAIYLIGVILIWFRMTVFEYLLTMGDNDPVVVVPEDSGWLEIAFAFILPTFYRWFKGKATLAEKPSTPPDPVAPKHVLPETFVPMTTNDSDRMYDAQKAKMMEGVDVPPEIARREAARAHWNEVYKAGKK